MGNASRGAYAAATTGAAASEAVAIGTSGAAFTVSARTAGGATAVASAAAIFAFLRFFSKPNES